MAELVELSQEAAMKRLNEAFGVVENDPKYDWLRESLSRVAQTLAIEDKDWVELFANDEVEGIDLEELQKASERIREAMVGMPIIKRASQLRISYIWPKGINLPALDAEVEKAKWAGRGAKSAFHKAALSTVNHTYVWGDTAHEEMERSAFSDGNFLLLGDNDAKTLRRIPLKEIGAIAANPDFGEEIWAYRRDWMQTRAGGKKEAMREWYYTDTFREIAKADPSIKPKTQIRKDPVSKTKTIIDIGFNKQVGWPLGLPDALPVLAWASLYNEFLKNGYVMSKALTQFAFKASVATQRAGDNASMKLAKPAGAGQTAVVGGPNDLTPLASAGKGYDFNSGRALAAQVAAACEVSIVHLLSDPGAAGSSYGSASNLDLPTKRAMISRQRAWVDYFRRILKWLDADDVTASFPDLEDPDFYREMQGILLAWSSGLMHEDEIRAELLRLLNIVTDKKKAPAGVMLPNNEKSWARADVDPKDNPNGGGEPTGASPDQGKSSPAGKAPGNSNDLRSDTLSSATESLRQEEIRGMFAELLERLDGAT